MNRNRDIDEKNLPKSVIVPPNSDTFLVSCEQQLKILNDLQILPPTYTESGLGLPNNPKHSQILIKVYTYIIARLNNKKTGKPIFEGETREKRFASEQTGLSITFHLVVDKTGNITLFFDPNSKLNIPEPGFFEFLQIFDYNTPKKIKIIGSGSQSQVRASAALSNGLIEPMVTAVTNDDEHIKNRLREKNILNELLVNPFVMPVVFGNEYKSKVGIKKLVSFSPRMTGTLDDLLHESYPKPDLTLENVLWTIHSLISGVTHLHKHRILHRDLKLQNILFSHNQHGILIKVADTGFARPISDINNGTGFAGTPDYLSFDNPYFKDLIQTLRNAKFQQILTGFIFLKAVDECKFGKRMPFENVNVQENSPTEILWEKFEQEEKFSWATTYAHEKEDVAQLCFMIIEIIEAFKIKNETLPPILNQILKHANINLRKVRADRDNILELQNYFNDQLNSFIERGDKSQTHQCRQLFKNQADFLQTSNPITHPLESKTLPEVKAEKADSHINNPISSNFDTLKNLIESDFWNGKTTWGYSVPDGIAEMQNKLTNYTEKDIFPELKEIVARRMSFSCFSLFKKRDPATQFFYYCIKQSASLEELFKNPIYTGVEKQLTQYSQKIQEDKRELIEILN